MTLICQEQRVTRCSARQVPEEGVRSLGGRAQRGEPVGRALDRGVHPEAGAGVG